MTEKQEYTGSHEDPQSEKVSHSPFNDENFRPATLDEPKVAERPAERKPEISRLPARRVHGY